MVKGKRKSKPKPSPHPPKSRKSKPKASPRPRQKRKRQCESAALEPPRKRLKPGPASYVSGKKLFRGAGYESQLTFAKDKKMSNATHIKRRRGYKLMWTFAEQKCLDLGFGRPGSFDADNGHNGECWGWPKECTMTNRKAGKILLHLINLGTMTLSQLVDVRKALAHSFQLKGNEVTKKSRNWPQANRVWDSALVEKECAPKTPNMPLRIPSPEQLREAFNRRWDPRKNEMSLLKWIIARRAAYDLLFSGHRPNEDCKKMKNSNTHVFNTEEGWCYTAFVDGRSKLSGPKKHSRDWKQYSVCWCENGRHVSPTLRDRYNLDRSGNPREGCRMGFDERCIIAGFEFTNLWLERYTKGNTLGWRRYPNLVGDGRGKSYEGNIGNKNFGSPIKLALDYMEDEGFPRFDTNCGRKASGKLYTLLNVPYEVSFEQHGDTFGTWEGKYQQGCRRERSSEFTRRDQSVEIEIVTKVIRKISYWMGLGAKKPLVQLSTLERQNDMILRAMGLGVQASQILMGMNAQLPDGYQTRRLQTQTGSVKPESVEPAKLEPTR